MLEFLGQIWQMLSLKDILTILDDIRLHFKEKKKKHQRALSSQNLKTKHKTYTGCLVALGTSKRGNRTTLVASKIKILIFFEKLLKNLFGTVEIFKKD